MKDSELTHEILSCVYKVHTGLGPGLLETSYQHCLEYELKRSGLEVEREKGLPILYYDVKLDCGYRIDLLVNQKIILELKAVEELLPIHLAQVLTYLKLANLEVGFLLNFNVPSMKNGIKRVVNNYLR